MEQVTSPYWNIFDSVVVDNSNKSYEFKEYKELNVTVANKERYEIIIQNNQQWRHLAGAYLYVKSKIDTVADNPVTISNNGINDFKIARLKYESKIIEEVDHLGITSTINNLVHFSGDVSDTMASQLCWHPDTSDFASRQRYVYEEADKGTQLKDSTLTLENTAKNFKHNPNFNKGYLERWQLTRDGKTFCKFIPLNRIFRFCRDINKVLKGEIVIELYKNTIKNILHASKDGDYKYSILDLSLWVPEVVPSINVLADLEKGLALSKPITYGWNALNCYRSNLQNAKSGRYNVVNNQHKIIGVYVVFSTEDRDESFLKSNMIFDHMNLQSIQIRVNGVQFPTEEYLVDFTPATLDYPRLYSAFLSGGFKNDMDEGTCVSYKDFSTLYPIIYFNLTKNDDDVYAKQKIAQLEVRWNLREQPAKNYYIYCVVESERLVQVNVRDSQLFLETN